MTIEKVVTGSGEVDVTGSGYRPEGELRVDGRPLDDPVLLDEVARGARGREPGERRRAARGRRRVDDPGRPDRGRVPRRRGEGRGAAPRRGEARFERVGEVPFTSERKLMSTLPGRRCRRARSSPSSPRARPTCCSRAAPQERVARRGATADRGAPERDPRDRRAARRPGAAHAGRRLPAAAAGRAAAGGRVGRARARLPRAGRDHRPAAAGGADGDRRGARRRRARADDHRRPPAHRGADRRRPRHRRRRLARRHRAPSSRRSTTTRAQPRCGRSPSTPASRPSTSCGSSTRCRPTAGSSR